MIKNAALGLALPLALLISCKPAEPHPNAYQGVVEFDERDVAFEIAGRVVELMVDHGAVVKQGVVVARLDDSLEKAAITVRDREVAAAEAQVDLVEAGSRPEEIRAARAQIRAVKATEALLRKNLEREQGLLAQGAVTQAVVDELDSRLASTTAEREALEQKLTALERGARKQEVGAATARVGAAAAALALERERAGRHELVAPVAGIVTDLHVEAGEVVGPGAPVLTVADTTHPYADVFVPQGESSGIRPGAPARAFIDAETRTIPGKVERIWERAEFTPRYLFSVRERANLVVRVRVRLEDPADRLPAGVPVFVELDRKKAP